MQLALLAIKMIDFFVLNVIKFLYPFIAFHANDL